MSDAGPELKLFPDVPIRFRSGGRWVYGLVVNDKWSEYQTIQPEEFPPWELGQTSFTECVWQGGRLVARRTVRPRKWN